MLYIIILIMIKFIIYQKNRIKKYFFNFWTKTITQKKELIFKIQNKYLIMKIKYYN